MLRIAFCIASLALATPVLAETAHSLDQVPQQLKTPEAKKFFREQMQGKPAPDLLGTHLPSALPANAITGLLVPADDKQKPNLIGARPWPASPNLYVAIVCTGGTAPYSANEPRCARSANDAKEPQQHIYLGLVAAKEGGKDDRITPILVAASGPIDCAMDWSATDLPRQPMAASDDKDGMARPESIDAFDLAHFRIAPDQLAFGVRAGWSESYSGGGASFTGLCLFVRDGTRLRQVLAVPMSAYSDVAGDWHKNGTRDHDVTDAANVLVVSSHMTDAHFDLVVKDTANKKQQMFRWSKDAGAYKAAAK